MVSLVDGGRRRCCVPLSFVVCVVPSAVLCAVCAIRRASTPHSRTMVTGSCAWNDDTSMKKTRASPQSRPGGYTHSIKMIESSFTVRFCFVPPRAHNVNAKKKSKINVKGRAGNGT